MKKAAIADAVRGGLQKLFGRKYDSPTNGVHQPIRFVNEHAHLVGSLDQFDWDIEGNANLSGWGKAGADQRPADKIIVTNNEGTVICETRCIEPRQDVCDYLKTDDMLHSGWRVSLPKGALNFPGTDINALNVYAYCATDSSAYRLPVYNYVDAELGAREEQNWLKASGSRPPDRTCPYYSCSNIEGGIIFLQNHVACICCFSNLNSDTPDDNIVLCSTERSEFSIKKVLEKRKEVITQNQQEGYAACKGCKQLRKRMWPSQQHLFNAVNIGHYASCNVTCTYCRPTLIANNPTDTPTEEIVEVIKELQARDLLAPNAAVAITGGEPAMMKGLDALMELLIHQEYAIQINSNGTIYSQKFADGLENGSIKLICVSADAITDDAYFKIKGKHLCEKVWKHIELYAAKNPESVMPKMIILDENLDQVRGFILKCRAAGVKNVMYDCNQKTTPSPAIVQGVIHFKQVCEEYGISGIPGPSIDRNLLGT